MECHHVSDANSSGNMEVVNTIFSQTVNQLYTLQEEAQLIITYSLSDTDTLPGETNLSDDPLFVDPETNDFHLLENSPCIDNGNPSEPFDSNGNYTDIGAFQFVGFDTTSVPTGMVQEIWPDVNNQFVKVKEEITVFPNPAENYLIIIHNGDKTSRYKIFSLSGELCLFGNILQRVNRLDLRDLVPGVYIIKLSGSEYKKSISIPFVKEQSF